MKATKCRLLIVAILFAVAIGCSSPSNVLVGEWQSTGSESVYVIFRNDRASDRSIYRRLSYTEKGDSRDGYWAVKNDSTLSVELQGGWGGFGVNPIGLQAESRKIISLSSNKLILEWGFGGLSPVRVIEFKRVK